MRTLLVAAVIALLSDLSHAQPMETIRVGVLAPLTGPRADGGAYVSNAASLAAEKLAGEQVKLELLVEDTRYLPKEALSGLHKLMLHSIQFVLAGGGSGEVLAIAPHTEQAKIIVLVPGAQSEEVSDAGKLIFRFIHNTAQEAPFFAGEVGARMTGRRLAIFAAQFSATPPYLKHFVPALQRAGKDVGLIEEFNVDTTDFRSQLLRLKQSGEKDLFMIAPAVNEGRIIAQARQLGLSPRFFGIGMESPDLVKMGGASVDGLIYAYSFDPITAGPAAHAFIKEYKDRFGVEPDTIAANTFDALMRLAACARHVQETTAVARCLYATKDYLGVGGRFSINDQGDAEKELFLKSVKNGKFVRLTE